jgi:hypothetical protein
MLLESPSPTISSHRPSTSQGISLKNVKINEKKSVRSKRPSSVDSSFIYVDPVTGVDVHTHRLNKYVGSALGLKNYFKNSKFPELKDKQERALDRLLEHENVCWIF